MIKLEWTLLDSSGGRTTLQVIGDPESIFWLWWNTRTLKQLVNIRIFSIKHEYEIDPENGISALYAGA